LTKSGYERRELYEDKGTSSDKDKYRGFFAGLRMTNISPGAIAFVKLPGIFLEV
jgi:hypothetical protein